MDRTVTQKAFDSKQHREINMSKLYDARAKELAHFTSAIKNKEKSISKTPMQRVPKHMRRRAMAHNRFRIPSRIRTISVKKSGVSESKALRCRKHIRNSKLLLLHYFKRSARGMLKGEGARAEESDSKWLETHLWHAKRMKMFKYYGFSVARKNFMKCLKGVYRLGKFKSVLYDRSYYSVLVVRDGEGDLGRLRELVLERFRLLGGEGSDGDLKLFEYFKKFLRGSGSGEAGADGSFDVSSTPGSFVGEFHLGGEALGDVQFLRFKEKSKGGGAGFVLICHPGSASHIKNTLTDPSVSTKYPSLSVEEKEDRFCIFEVFGPHSLLALELSLEGDIQGQNQLFELTRLAHDPIYYPLGTSFVLDVKLKQSKTNKRSPFDPSYFEREQLLDDFFGQKGGNYFGDDQSKINEFIQGVFESDLIGYLGRFKIQKRGRHTHKRPKKQNNEPKNKDKNSKNQEKEKKSEEKERATLLESEKMAIEGQTEVALNQESALEAVKIHQADNLQPHVEENQNAADSLLQYLKNKEKEQFSILIMNNSNHSKRVRKLRILAPLGKGRKLFERLASKAAITVGKVEIENMLSQLGLRVFPRDYPDSQAFRDYEEAQEKEKLKIRRKRPPRKRNNYEKLGSPSALKLDLESFLQKSDKAENEDFLREVRIEMIDKSVPADLSYVCFPRKDDFVALMKLYEEENQILDKILNSNENSTLMQFEGAKEGQDGTQDAEDHREIIGRTTTGFFSFEAGKGVGRGFASNYWIKKLEQVTKAFSEEPLNHFKVPSHAKAIALVKKTTSKFYHYCYLSF